RRSENRVNTIPSARTRTAQVTGSPISVDTQLATVTPSHVDLALVRKRHTPYAVSMAMIGTRANHAGGRTSATIGRPAFADAWEVISVAHAPAPTHTPILDCTCDLTTPFSYGSLDAHRCSCAYCLVRWPARRGRFTTGGERSTAGAVGASILRGIICRGQE